MIEVHSTCVEWTFDESTIIPDSKVGDVWGMLDEVRIVEHAEKV